jgi:hypothetical protein
VTVNAGQILQWSDFVDSSGAVFKADHPIGLFTGNTLLFVSSETAPSGGARDSAHQQIPHVKALGSEYVGGGVVTRFSDLAPESVPYRMLGVVDGTVLVWDPQPPTGAPMQLNAGQVAEFQTTTTFTVRSQDDDHPFALTEYMAGNPNEKGRLDSCDPRNPLNVPLQCALGDEEWVNLLPPKQFRERYVFFTDPTYATTNLVITRVKGPKGFSDVKIACLGGNVGGWQPVGNEGKYEVAYVDLVRGTVPVAQCGTTRHEATSDGAFGVVVWGTDWFTSYAFPAGGNIGAINPVDVTPGPK